MKTNPTYLSLRQTDRQAWDSLRLKQEEEEELNMKSRQVQRLMHLTAGLEGVD